MIHDSSFPPLQNLAKCAVPSSASRVARDPLSSSFPGAESPEQRLVGDSTPRSTISAVPVIPGPRSGDLVSDRAHMQLQLTIGLIEGFMLSLGFPSLVEGSIIDRIPVCAFTVSLKQASSDILDPSRLLGNVRDAETASI